MHKIIVFLVACVIGSVINACHVPIPFMLGGIFAALIGKIGGLYKVQWSIHLRSAGLIVTGYGTGRYVTEATIGQAVTQLPGVVGATLVATAIAIVTAVWMSRHSDVNLQSLVMGILPGGFMQMVAMSDDDARVDRTVVAVLQSLRLSLILIMVPFLIKEFLHAPVVTTSGNLALTGGVSFWYCLPACVVAALFMQKIHGYTPFLLGPVLMAATLSLTVGPLGFVPDYIMRLAQLCVGVYVGAGLDLERLKKMGQLLPATFCGIFAMLGASVGVAHLLSKFYAYELPTAFLAMAPGGMAEMCLAAMGVGGDVAVVLTYQLFRFLFINITGPFSINKYFGPAVPRT